MRLEASPAGALAHHQSTVSVTPGRATDCTGGPACQNNCRAGKWLGSCFTPNKLQTCAN